MKKGYKDRRICPLPKIECLIRILHGKDLVPIDCLWIPYPIDCIVGENIPPDYYLGIAKSITYPYIGIGFRAWQSNDSEFVYYKVIKSSCK